MWLHVLLILLFRVICLPSYTVTLLLEVLAFNLHLG